MFAGMRFFLYFCKLFHVKCMIASVIMFMKTRKNMAGVQSNTGSMYNSLTAGSKIIGTVITDNDIRVDGTIEGDVKCAGKIVVGEKGSVMGTITCQNAEIMGRVEGKIEAAQSLTMSATCHVHGEIQAQTLTVEPNAVFNGTCAMGKAEKK